MRQTLVKVRSALALARRTSAAALSRRVAMSQRVAVIQSRKLQQVA